MNTYTLCQALCVILVGEILAEQDEYQRFRTACNYDSDCIPNAYCRDQSYCRCKQDFIIHATGSGNFSCLQEAVSLNDPCEANIQCTRPFGIHAECSINSAGYGECKCRSGAHFTGDRCYQTSLIGQSCSVSNNCHLTSGIPSYCVRSVCTCPNNFRPNQDGSDCIRIAQLDEPCENEKDCITENSRCAEVCRCRVNFIQSKEKDACLRAADKLGDACVEHDQCTMFLVRAECAENGSCMCIAGHHHVPSISKCFRNIQLGEMCERNEECVALSSECISGRCQCTPGFSNDNNNCVRTSNSGVKTTQHGTCFLFLLLFLLRIFESVVQCKEGKNSNDMTICTL